jgi:hypothetical protein
VIWALRRTSAVGLPSAILEVEAHNLDDLSATEPGPLMAMTKVHLQALAAAKGIPQSDSPGLSPERVRSLACYLNLKSNQNCVVGVKLILSIV